MRNAARQLDDEEPPPGEDPRERAAALDARFERVLLGLEAGRRDQDLMIELIATGRRYAENTATYKIAKPSAVTPLATIS